MGSPYVVMFSAQAESTYRGFHNGGSDSKPHLESVKKVINTILSRNPANERFELAGKLSNAYRVKQGGVIVDYMVQKSKVRVICICLSEDNICDGIQVLNTLVNSGVHQQFLRDIGFPEPLIGMTRTGLSAFPQ